MKTVMIFGTFDILHQGHLSVFQQAKKLGDHLIAVIARDKRVEQLKKAKPVHTEKERKSLLEHIDLIDEVLLGDLNDVYLVIQKKQPDIIALGYDQHHFVDALQEKLAEWKFDTKIIRLKPYKQDQYKSSAIRRRLERMT